MTLDPKLRDLFAAGDEIVAQLDRLNAASQARRFANLDALKAVVANLDRPGPPDEPEQEVIRPERDEPRRPRRERDLTEEEAEALLPRRRTSRGGPMGPALRERLVREALAKSDW